MTDLGRWFRERNIRGVDVANKTGYALGHVYALLNGQYPVNASAKYRLMAAYPDLLHFFTEEETHEGRVSESIR